MFCEPKRIPYRVSNLFILTPKPKEDSTISFDEESPKYKFNLLYIKWFPRINLKFETFEFDSIDP